MKKAKRTVLTPELSHVRAGAPTISPVAEPEPEPWHPVFEPVPVPWRPIVVVGTPVGR